MELSGIVLGRGRAAERGIVTPATCDPAPVRVAADDPSRHDLVINLGQVTALRALEPVLAERRVVRAV